MKIKSIIYQLTKFFAAITFLWLAHCIGDYALQTKSVALFKCKSLLICIIHASIWTGIMLIGFAAIARLGLLLGKNQTTNDTPITWPPFLLIAYILLISHVIIDFYKIYTTFFPALPDDLSKFNPFTQQLLLVDQSLHAISIIFCYFLLSFIYRKTTAK